MSECCNNKCDNKPSYSFSNTPTESNKDCCDKDVVKSSVMEAGGTASTNQGESLELILLGRVGDRMVRFPDEANGFIRIVNGVATLDSSFPLFISTFLHQISSDPTSDPSEAPYEVVADATGFLQLQAGLQGIDSIRYWDGDIGKYVTTELYNLPRCVKGCVEKAECIEITGLDASAVPDNDTIRKPVALKGSGIVVIEDQENLANPTKPLSKGRSVKVPEDLTSQGYILSWSGAGGYVWQQLTVLNGNDGVSPIINSDGNWEIGGIDTGVQAQGPQGIPGLTPFINPQGRWQIGTTDTGVNAAGPAPIINLDGNWEIDGIDTGVNASGVAGDPGTEVTIVDGKWHLDGVDTGVFADVLQANIVESTESFDQSQVYVATISIGQSIDPAVETPLNLSGLGSSGGISHTNGIPLITVGSDVEYVEIEVHLFCDDVTVTDAHSILRLYRTFGLSPVLLAETGISEPNKSTTLRFLDRNPSDGTSYSIAAQSADAIIVDGVSFSTNHVSVKVVKKIDAVTSFTVQ